MLGFAKLIEEYLLALSRLLLCDRCPGSETLFTILEENSFAANTPPAEEADTLGMGICLIKDEDTVVLFPVVDDDILRRPWLE